MSEALLRLAVFISLFTLFFLLEYVAPRRKQTARRSARLFTNLSITVLNTLSLRALAIGLPLLAMGAAMDAQTLRIGLFNNIDLPGWLAVAATILFLDFAVWTQHWITHKVPLFWRFHQMHHSDREFDVTTAVRFHPIEILASMLLKIALVYAIGAPPLAVLLFEIILNGTALFNHANVSVPLGLDRVLRLFLVTPDMHRVHHSNLRAEHDSNYGFSLSIWDRIFGTYIAQPSAGHTDMIVGQKWQDEKPDHLRWSMMLPFLRKP